MEPKAGRNGFMPFLNAFVRIVPEFELSSPVSFRFLKCNALAPPCLRDKYEEVKEHIYILRQTKKTGIEHKIQYFFYPRVPFRCLRLTAVKPQNKQFISC